MLLNLFLAILLKSISEIGTKEKEDEAGEEGKKADEEVEDEKDGAEGNE